MVWYFTMRSGIARKTSSSSSNSSSSSCKRSIPEAARMPVVETLHFILRCSMNSHRETEKWRAKKSGQGRRLKRGKVEGDEAVVLLAEVAVLVLRVGK